MEGPHQSTWYLSRESYPWQKNTVTEGHVENSVGIFDPGNLFPNLFL
jgi:hypothetical protein